jgi:hypothetical protein
MAAVMATVTGLAMARMVFKGSGTLNRPGHSVAFLQAPSTLGKP